MRGTGAGELIKIAVQNFDVLAGPMVSLAYPLYASIREIENRSTASEQQWLTYWILHSMITLFELTFVRLIEWIPLWSYIRLILTCWLIIPQYKGATFVYKQYVRPFVNGQNFNISRIQWNKGIFVKHEPEDILTAVEKYIKENGTESLEKLIRRADQNKSYGDTWYTDYNEDYTRNTCNEDVYYTDYNDDCTSNTCYDDVHYTNYNEDYTYTSFGE